MDSDTLDNPSNFAIWFRRFLVLAAVLAIVIYSVIYWQRGKHMRKLAENIPGPPTLPIIGNTYLILSGDLSNTFKVVQGLIFYGTVIKFWMCNLLILGVFDPVVAEKIIGNKKFLSKTEYATKMFKPLFKNGIIVNEGETWKLHRRILAPHFGENIVRKYIPVFYKYSTTLADRLQSFADGSSLFKIYELAFFCTMNTAYETTTGNTFSPDLSENVDIPRGAMRILDILSERFRRPWLIFDWVFNFTSIKKESDSLIHFLQKQLESLLEEKIKQLKESDTRTNMENVTPLVERLLMGGQMTMQEMHEEMLNVLGAASDTTATLYCYTMCMLGIHQDIQERLFQEQKCIFREDPYREVSWEDLQKMTYTEQVVKEVLRLYPPFTLLFRTIEEDTDVGNGIVLPKGGNAVVFTFLLHRNPRYFPDPEKFDPERFSAKNSEGRHPYCYLPFGAGRRVCLGYKYAMLLVKMMLSITLRRYRVVNTVGGREAIDRSLEMAFIMKPACGFNVQIAPRVTT